MIASAKQLEAFILVSGLIGGVVPSSPDVSGSTASQAGGKEGDREEVRLEEEEEPPQRQQSGPACNRPI